MNYVYNLLRTSYSFIVINNCLSSPCQFDGQCVNYVNNYTCSCVPGYTDKDCTTGKNNKVINV